jgi:bifunctional DNA-binding transcriptional regulator/antitoxin component of YhaV-PrlF toxin-antitoxin module
MNLRQNPSEESRKDLYTFLEKNHVPITEDGYFVAYKGVNNDFTDNRTGSYDNSIGKTVKMPRDQVNPDRNQTCSTGLHVAAYEYAKGFAALLIEVKVNPRDVVSVPTDYNAQKMRVCEYTVVAECENELKEELYGHPGDVGEEGVDVDDMDNDIEDSYDTEGVEEDCDITETFDSTPIPVSLDSYGRMTVPAVLIRKMGLMPGDDAYVSIMDECIFIDNTENDSDGKVYKVDKSYNIRIAESFLKEVWPTKKERDKGHEAEYFNDGVTGEDFNSYIKIS